MRKPHGFWTATQFSKQLKNLLAIKNVFLQYTIKNLIYLKKESVIMFKTFLLLFALTILFVLVGGAIARKRGMIIAFVLALVINFASYWFSDSIVLNMYSAQPAPAGHRLERITKRLVRKAKLPMPKIYIIPSNSPNAFATGRNPEHAAVAATKGILSFMSDSEIEAIMAHELGHVNNRDTLISTVAASVSGGIFILSRMAMFFGGRGKRSFGTRIAVAILAPIAASLITFAISRDREYAADEYSARLTGKPINLAKALIKLKKGVRHTPMKDHSPETAHMFIVHPFSVASSVGELFSTHPPMEKRVRRLRIMMK